MIAQAEIERMSLPERLRMMDSLWESISRNPDEVTSPNWHKKILDSRRKKIAGGEAKFLTVEELKRRLRRSDK